ncbi:phospholipase A [Desulfatibacillum aliphaticivorans]|uniref:Phosphatidylcholine 1-acylhydrolase n=1 Tax=Desulfatibacillum aliphaticivorans TaxID=218208 RepID=B8FHZ0_DESAL|nr:phospholipase A [Desulfatibacillum aliphaticivorans]ACL02557.1 Outer membrane phospholipase A-like protein [Desulfatibacillum aliphaticivorans]
MKINGFKAIFIAVLALCLATPAWGTINKQSLDFVLAPPSSEVKAGGTTRFYLYVHNPEDREMQFQAEPVLNFSLGEWPENKTLEGRLVSSQSQDAVAIPAQGFKKLEYDVVFPTDFSGVAVFKVDAYHAPPLMFEVEEAVPDQAHLFTAKEPEVTVEKKGAAQEDGGDLAQDSEKGEGGEEVSVESLFAQYQPYLTNLAPYEPMYFLVGADPENSKFQFSFRYRFFKPEDEFTKKHPWLAGLHFAYTQTSFWDLQSESAPFKDTSYKPEFFYASGNLKTRPSWMHGLFYQAGFQHESNGRDEEASRSTNFLYIRPGFAAIHKRTKLGFSASSKIWAYVNNEDETNPDLASYRGYFDIDLKLGKADGLVLGTNFRLAHEGASVQADLTYPLHNLIWKHLNLCLQAQYVNSLAESLLHYDERTEAFRIGFAMVR